MSFKASSQTRSASSDANRQKAGHWKKQVGNLFGSSAAQVIGAILLSICIPLVIRFGFSDIYFRGPVFQNTITGGSIAIIIGVYINKNVAAFPSGIKFWYVFTSLSASFLLVILVLFFLRLSYSLYIVLFSYLFSILWVSVCLFISQSLEPHKVAVVPSGAALRLCSLPGREWTQLSEPRMDVSSYGALVADLRAELSPEWERFLTESAVQGVPVFHYKQVLESLTGRLEIEHLSENTLGSLLPSRSYLTVKRVLDTVFAAGALVMLAPLLFILAILIKFDSEGPAIFRQKRRGFRGQDFTVYKFRTMRIAEEVEEVNARERAITQDGDSRITKLGGYLRKTRLDELPQIVNILKGEMSWIGPRPEAVSLSEWYEAELPFYRYRHIVKPGITGWAQVMQGHVTSTDDVLEKLHYDFFYIKNFSFWLDALICIKTINIVFTGFGAK